MKRENPQRVDSSFPANLHLAVRHRGCVCRLGERDQAFAWLEKAYEERERLMLSLRVNRRLDPLRSDPRFTDLLRRVGLQ